MAFVPDRVEPVFGDALAGDGGMTEPAPADSGSGSSFDVFPDALSALPLPALTFLPPVLGGATGVPADVAAAAPGLVVTAARPAPTRPPAGRAPSRSTAAAARSGPPTGPAWSGYPPPGQPFAVPPPPIAPAAQYSRPPALPRQTRPAPLTASTGGVLAPGSSRRPTAGVGYTPPPTTASSVARPPAYLPQNSGLAGFRAAAQQARGGRRPPASPPSATRPAAPTGPRRTNRASSAWALIVFVIIFLVGSGTGHQLIEAISRLLHHR